MATPKKYNETFGDKKIIISISGIIGCGKSYITANLAQKTGGLAIYEPVETNTYLSDFYIDMKKYGFNMQIYLLNHRYRQHQQMVWSDASIIIQDRSIYEDVIFAKMLNGDPDKLIDDRDFQTYCDLFANMGNFLHQPDLILYLDVEPAVALERVKMRGRECEKNLSLDYLSALRCGYEDWLKNQVKQIPVLRINYNKFKTTDEIIAEISDFIQKNNIGKSLIKI